eukprot:s1267_g4.t1
MAQQKKKVAPSYDGSTSFFAFEDAVDGWCDFTELDPEKREFALRNRPKGEAAVHKRLLDKDFLRSARDAVNYFKRFLRPHFIKGAQTEKVSSISGDSPYLLAVLVAYMLVVYSFFFNLLVARLGLAQLKMKPDRQFCGVYAALAEDILGYAMLARGEVILDTLKAIPMKRWNAFLKSLALDQKVDFEEGDIGLAGGVKAWEPSLAHPTTQEPPLALHGLRLALGNSRNQTLFTLRTK